MDGDDWNYQDDDFNENISYFELQFGIEDIHLLYDCVCRRIQNWEGAPSRHPFEQEHLSKLKSELYKAILDFKFYDES